MNMSNDNDCKQVGAGPRACPADGRPRGDRPYACDGATTGGSPLLIILTTFLLILSVAGMGIAGEKARIVSHLPSLTEICFALDLGDQLVGVSDFCNWPPEAAKLPRAGGVLNPHFELVVSLKPDRVLLQNTDRGLLRRYKALGIKTLPVKTAGIADVIDSIRLIGNEFGRKAQAAALMAKIENSFDEVKKVAEGKSQSAMIVIGHEPGSLREIYIAAKGSFHDELLAMTGGRNCFDRSLAAYPKISKEAIISKSPEIIILLYPQDSMSQRDIAKKKALWSPLSTVRAVKNGRICVVHGGFSMIPGPRMARIAREFSKCVGNRQK